VIDFVAEGASQEIFAADFKGFSFGVFALFIVTNWGRKT